MYKAPKKSKENLNAPEAPGKRATPASSAVDVVPRRQGDAGRRPGFTLFLTGLSGAGKSTIANALTGRLMELSGRHVTLLDGDAVRQLLSSELGFSKEHRDLNIRRIGFVASEVTHCGGIAVCAAIAPYDALRKELRRIVESGGPFILAHVATPLAVCEQRDTKGLYAKARAGMLPQFTGVSDPYEKPADAEITIDTTHVSVEEAVDEIVSYLTQKGCLPAVSSAVRENHLARA